VNCHESERAVIIAVSHVARAYRLPVAAAPDGLSSRPAGADKQQRLENEPLRDRLTALSVLIALIVGTQR
jgi:hypothetical protein